MARAITSPELALLRADGQRTRLYLAIHSPATVMACRVNQTFGTHDKISQVTFDTVTSGAYTNVLEGMTVWVGSTAGASDLGQCRVRKAPTSTVLYIGETSEIDWDDNLYLTVVDEFGLWPKLPKLDSDGETLYIDTDVAYSDQNDSFRPFPVLGPPRVAWLTGASVNITPNAGGSWVIGSTIASYLWTAPGASATANLNTASPTITYNAAGTYRIGCTVTTAAGKSWTGYRTVFVFSAASMPAVDFTVGSIEGNFENGDWQFAATLVDATLIDSVKDRALVVLFATDLHGSTAGSLGPVAGSENVIACGWISGDTIRRSPQYDQVDFVVHGPAYWLKRCQGAAVKLAYASAAENWNQMSGMTVDRAISHVLHWRSTTAAVIDVVNLTGKTHLISNLDEPARAIWELVQEIADWELASPACDRYGRMFVERDIQYTALAERDALPMVMDITGADWQEQAEETVTMERQTTQLELAATQFDGSVTTFRWSRSPGNATARFGRLVSRDRALVDDQDECNLLCGFLQARENNPYPVMDVSLGMNNRFIDIAPRQFVTFSDAADDPENPPRLIARRVSFNFDGESDFLATTLELETETLGDVAATYIPPPTGELHDGPSDLPDFINPFDSLFGEPPEVVVDEPNLGNACPNDAPANGPFSVWIRGTVLPSDGRKFAYLDGVSVRSSGHTNKTAYMITGKFWKKVGEVWEETLEDDWYNVYAIGEDGLVAATGVHDAVVGDGRTRTGVISPAARTDIIGFALELNKTAFSVTDHGLAISTQGAGTDWVDNHGYDSEIAYYGYDGYSARVIVDALLPTPGYAGGWLQFVFWFDGLPHNSAYKVKVRRWLIRQVTRFAESDGIDWIQLVRRPPGGSFEVLYEDDFASYERFSLVVRDITTGLDFGETTLGIGFVFNIEDWGSADSWQGMPQWIDMEVFADDSYKMTIENFLVYNLCGEAA